MDRARPRVVTAAEVRVGDRIRNPAPTHAAHAWADVREKSLAGAEVVLETDWFSVRMPPEGAIGIHRTVTYTATVIPEQKSQGLEALRPDAIPAELAQEALTYEFQSEAELSAFQKGLEMGGAGQYRVVNDPALSTVIAGIKRATCEQRPARRKNNPG